MQAEQIAREKELDPALPESPQVQQASTSMRPGSKSSRRSGAMSARQGGSWRSRPLHSSVARGRRAAARSSTASRTLRSATSPGAARWHRMDRPATEAKVVARALFLAAQRGERIGIVGPNGAGKTTLLRTIAGDLPPLDGSITFGNAVQDSGHLAQLRSAGSPADGPRCPDGGCAGHCRRGARVPARFLFRGDDAFKEVRLLSGGERSRLELALLGIQPSNLLLLDEPTNHLDIPAREAIEAFMAGVGDAAGGVTRSAVAGDGLREVVGREGGAAVAFDGGYREWRAAVAADGRSGRWSRKRPVTWQPPPRRRALRVPTALRGLTGPVRARPPVRRKRGSRHHPQARKVVGEKDKLSKEAYRRQKAVAEGELTRFGLRKLTWSWRWGIRLSRGISWSCGG